MTGPEPDDDAVMLRMRAAHARACSILAVRAMPDAREAWGRHGRTLGQAVSTAGDPAWLRLASAFPGQIGPTFWNGNVDAEKAIPASIPRPRLRAWHDWTERQCEYRAELYDLAPAQTVAPTATLTAQPELPAAWWAALRHSLDTIAVLPTVRATIRQSFLDRAMHRHFGTIDTSAPTRWTTAHGDLHYANICGPVLYLLDWEGWGSAPEGYDAAMLHSYSLLVPETARRVRREFRHLLDTPAGRFAELVTIGELLHTAAGGDMLHRSLRERAAAILGRPVR